MLKNTTQTKWALSSRLVSSNPDSLSHLYGTGEVQNGMRSVRENTLLRPDLGIKHMGSLKDDIARENTIASEDSSGSHPSQVSHYRITETVIKKGEILW